MVRVSNAIFDCINFIPLVLGLFSVAVSIYFSRNGGTFCQTTVRNPLLITGLVLLVISVLAFVGSCYKNANIFLTIYSILLILIVLALFCMTFFALIVANKGLSKKNAGIGFGSYRIKDFSGWLKKNFVDHQHWEQVRSCLSESHICRKLHSDKTMLGFMNRKFSMIQSGCCKPPMYCKFEYKNTTFWEMPKSGPDVPDSDCITWSNDPHKLCYDCKSCKGGFLADLKKQWRFLAVVNLFILVIILITFNIGCSIRRRRNTKSDDVTQQTSQHQTLPQQTPSHESLPAV